MIRATNTGATVIIDRFGHVTDALPRVTRGVLVGDVEGGTVLTPFARWVSRLGLAPLWAVALAAALLACWPGLRRPQP
jgi:apolipoprotein N-acyltransferase